MVQCANVVSALQAARSGSAWCYMRSRVGAGRTDYYTQLVGKFKNTKQGSKVLGNNQKHLAVQTTTPD